METTRSGVQNHLKEQPDYKQTLSQKGGWKKAGEMAQSVRRSLGTHRKSPNSSAEEAQANVRVKINFGEKLTDKPYINISSKPDVVVHASNLSTGDAGTMVSVCLTPARNSGFRLVWAAQWDCLKIRKIQCGSIHSRHSGC